MWLFRFIIVFSMISCILAGCAREDKPTLNKAVWSSRDPFNIPYNRRMNEYMEGNKVVNPSFERGRVFSESLNTYELTGWKEVGEEIEWVNTARHEFDSTESNTGNHAIKISRSHISEVEEDGVGIMGDYIKVFPGNYELNYSIRLRDICPNKERLGSRLMDAVNVRIFYYDKNKIRIDGNTKIPGKVKKFDNEFKALPFSGFWNIDSLGWIRARGISHKFPFSDGDMPDNIRYVRLFFGLKGTGTLWLDDVSLKFSKQNFTLLESLQRWQDTVFKPTDLLVPEVKHLENKAKLTYYDPENPMQKPQILIPRNSDQITLKAARMLKEEMMKLSDKKWSVPIVESVDTTRENRSLVFSIGNNMLNQNSWARLPYNKIKEREQGYFIQRFNDSSNTIAVSGNDPIGTYYGITTLIQLLDKDKPIYHHANIIDYPDFTQRGIYYSADSSNPLSKIDFLTRIGFNRIYSGIHNGMNQELKQDIRILGNNSLNGDLYKAGISVNPYKFTSEKKPGYLLQENNRKMLQSLILYSRKHSVNGTLLRMDNTINLKDSCSCLFDSYFEGNYTQYRNLLDVHSRLINEVASWTGQTGEVSFLPLWHNNSCIIRSHGKGEIYLKELARKVPDETEFLWTGPVNHPLIIDEAETKYIKKRYSKEPVFMSTDINPYTNKDFIRYYPGKARMASIFDHIKLDLPRSFADHTSSRFIAEMNPDSRIDQIKVKTLADYLWNARNFHSDFSLLKILISEYGKETAFDLIRFNEAYFGLYEMYGKIKTKETKRKYIRSAEDFKFQLDRIMQTLRKHMEDKPILSDLEHFKQKADGFYKQIQNR